MKDEYALLRTGQNWPKKCHFRPPTGGMCLYSSSAMNKASENAKVSILAGYLNKNFGSGLDKSQKNDLSNIVNSYLGLCFSCQANLSHSQISR